MAVVALINGEQVELQDYSIEVASTPTSISDSSGHVGTIQISIPGLSLSDALRYQGGVIEIDDSRRGQITGYIDDMDTSHDSGIIQLTGTTKLSDLNIYNVEAAPYHGTLRGAFLYYAGLAGQTINMTNVPSELQNLPVNFIAWEGDLWVNLKTLASAYQLEIIMSNMIIALRPMRERDARFGGVVTQTPGFQRDPIAQSVEVYQYKTSYETNGFIYPPANSEEEIPVISVGAGETSETNLEVSLTIYSFPFITPFEQSKSYFGRKILEEICFLLLFGKLT